LFSFSGTAEEIGFDSSTLMKEQTKAQWQSIAACDSIFLTLLVPYLHGRKAFTERFRHPIEMLSYFVPNARSQTV
jgi:hypothetical protein